MVLFSTQRGTEDSLLAKPSRRERFTEEVVIAMWGEDSLLAKPSRRERFTEEVVIAMWGLVLQDVVATIFLDPG
jgi:hypothetical protein